MDVRITAIGAADGMLLANVAVPADALVGDVHRALKEECEALTEIEFALIHKSAILRSQTPIKDAALKDGSSVSVLLAVPDFSGHYSHGMKGMPTNLYLYSEGEAYLEEHVNFVRGGTGNLARRARVGTWALRVVDSPVRPGVKEHIIRLSLTEEIVHYKWGKGLMGNKQRRRISVCCTLKAKGIERPTKLSIEDYISVLDEENPTPTLAREKEPLPPVMGDREHWFQELVFEEPSSDVPTKLMGISLRYLTEEFAAKAKERTMLPSPTFYDLKANFWLPKTLTGGPDAASQYELFNCDDPEHNRSHGLVTGQQVVVVGEDVVESRNHKLPMPFVVTHTGNQVTFHMELPDPESPENAMVLGSEIKEVHPLGFNKSNEKTCMTDLKSGCSVIDTLAHAKSPDVGMSTAYVSWVWKYPIDTLFSALQKYVIDENLNPSTTFFWICFFQNNQHRIIAENKLQTADTLGEVFATQLMSIGRMVIVIDDWKVPQYCSRVWTLFEAYQGLKNGIPMTAVFPDKGKSATDFDLDGFTLRDAVEKICGAVDVERAESWQPEDKAAILEIIRGSHGGTDDFNSRVRTLIWDALMDMAKQAMQPDVLKNPGDAVAAKSDYQKLQMYQFMENWHKSQSKKHTVAMKFAQSAQRHVQADLDRAGREG